MVLLQPILHPAPVSLDCLTVYPSHRVNEGLRVVDHPMLKEVDDRDVPYLVV